MSNPARRRALQKQKRDLLFSKLSTLPRPLKIEIFAHLGHTEIILLSNATAFPASMKREILIRAEQVMTPTFQYLGSIYHTYCYGCLRERKDGPPGSFYCIHDLPGPSVFSLGGERCGERRCRACDRNEGGWFLEAMTEEVKERFPKWTERMVAGLFELGE